MAKLRLEQVLSNMSYNSGSNNLIISGSAEVVSTPTQTGSFSIQDIDSFGDSGSFFTVDLGDY
jgi:hypothetical protein